MLFHSRAPSRHRAHRPPGRPAPRGDAAPWESIETALARDRRAGLGSEGLPDRRRVARRAGGGPARRAGPLHGATLCTVADARVADCLTPSPPPPKPSRPGPPRAARDAPGSCDGPPTRCATTSRSFAMVGTLEIGQAAGRVARRGLLRRRVRRVVRRGGGPRGRPLRRGARGGVRHVCCRRRSGLRSSSHPGTSRSPSRHGRRACPRGLLHGRAAPGVPTRPCRPSASPSPLGRGRGPGRRRERRCLVGRCDRHRRAARR